MNELGSRLKVARIEKGLSIYELAQKAQISVTTITMAENGSRKPYGRSLKKLADALEIPLTELVRIEKAKN